MSQFAYVRSFDGIRAIAVVAVIGKHLSYGMLAGGWAGVDLFFLLSGFLITSILLAEAETRGSIALTNFYIRRMLRLLAPILLTVALGDLLWNVIAQDGTADRTIASLSSLFYLANIVQESILGPFVHLWSLAVEEHFYFLWPLVLSTLLLRLSYANQVVSLLTAIAFATGLRLYLANHPLSFGLFSFDAYRFSFARMDNLLMGCLLAIVLQKQDFQFFKSANTSRLFARLFVYAALLVFLGIVATISSYAAGWRNGGFLLTNLACLILVVAAINCPDHELLANRVLQWLGQRSYGLYIYHYPIYLASESLRTPHDMLNLVWVTVFRIIVSVAVAELSFHYVEIPLLRLKSKFKNSSIGEGALLPKPMAT